MAWYVDFYLAFKKTDNLFNEFESLVKKLGNNTNLFNIKKIKMYKNSIISERLELEKSIFPKNYEVNVAEFMRKAKEKVKERQDFVLEVEFRVNRLLETRYLQTSDEFVIESGSVTSNLFLRGNQASWNYGIFNPDLNLIYEVGKHHKYNPKVYQTHWEKNFEAVIDELLYIQSVAPIKEIVGTRSAFDSNPQDTFLIFKADCADFILDIPHSLTSSARKINWNDIKKIAEASNSNFILTNSDGIFIFSSESVIGNLQDFYKNLANYK